VSSRVGGEYGVGEDGEDIPRALGHAELTDLLLTADHSGTPGVWRKELGPEL
jgi:hypothetical protein